MMTQNLIDHSNGVGQAEKKTGNIKLHEKKKKVYTRNSARKQKSK